MNGSSDGQHHSGPYNVVLTRRGTSTHNTSAVSLLRLRTAQLVSAVTISYPRPAVPALNNLCMTANTIHVSLKHGFIILQHGLNKSNRPLQPSIYPQLSSGQEGPRTYQFGGLYPGGRPDVPCQPHTITILVLVDKIRPSRHHRSLMFRDGRNLYDSRMTKAFVTTHAIAPLVCFNKVCDVTLTTLLAGRTRDCYDVT